MCMKVDHSKSHSLESSLTVSQPEIDVRVMTEKGLWIAGMLGLFCVIFLELLVTL